jgi:hypothetical protein
LCLIPASPVDLAEISSIRSILSYTPFCNNS